MGAETGFTYGTPLTNSRPRISGINPQQPFTPEMPASTEQEQAAKPRQKAPETPAHGNGSREQRMAQAGQGTSQRTRRAPPERRRK